MLLNDYLVIKVIG